MVLGVVGGYCAGKSTLTGYLQEKGWYLIDLDILGHRALQVKRDEVVAQFGEAVLAGDGTNCTEDTIDRKALGKIVFSDAQKLKNLESLVHPWMVEECKRLIHSHHNTLVDTALLFHMGLDTVCHAIVLIKTPAIIRLFRGMKRDGLSCAESLKRVKKASETIPKQVHKISNLYTIGGGRSVIARWKQIEPQVMQHHNCLIGLGNQQGLGVDNG